VLVYLLISFGLAWAVQVGVALTAGEQMAGLLQSSGGLIVALLLMWPPAVGAFVARRWVERSGFGDAGLRRGPWRFIAIAWLSPPLFTVAAILISVPIYPLDLSFSGLRDMAAQTGQKLPAAPWVVVAAQIALGLTLAVPFNAIFAFGEEFGWRGYLQPRLITLLGRWPGMLAHGAIWGFWHAPLIFLLGYNYPGHPWLGVLWFTVTGVLLGVLFGWLRLASGSVLPPTMAHASFNAIAGLPLLMLSGMDAAVAGVLWSPVGWLVLVAAIGWLVWTGALSSAETREAAR
jgi:membrane protease YdiL (CAAX protease family)